MSGANAMPERYSPDPWIDRTVHQDARRPGPDLMIPDLALSSWIDAMPGDTLRVAPRSERSVTVGYDVPAIIGKFVVSKRNQKPHPRAKVPKFVLSFIDAQPGECVRFKRLKNRKVRIIRQPEVPQ